MKRRKNEDGFVMLEVLAVLMIVLLLISTLYGTVGMGYRRTLAKIDGEEAYYAALTAVRLMAREVVKTEAEEGTASCALTQGSGMNKKTTVIEFESDEDGETIEVPVIVWSDCKGDELILGAESGTGAASRTVTMRLKKEVEVLELSGEDQEIEATASNPVKVTVSRWVPVSYGI